MAKFIQVAPNYRVRYDSADLENRKRADLGELPILDIEGSGYDSPDLPSTAQGYKPPKVSPVSLLSSDQGVSDLNRTKETETRLKGTKVEKPTPETEPVEEGFVEFINPTTEQTQKRPLSSLTQDEVNNLNSQGYQFSGGEGNIPSWVSGDGQSNQLQQGLDQTQADLEKAKEMLLSFSVEGDPEFQRVVDSTNRTYDRRADLIRENANAAQRSGISSLAEAGGMAVTSGRYSESGRALPGVVQGMISQSERKIMKNMQELQEDREEALVKARQLYEKGKWGEYVDLVEIAEDSYNKQLDKYLELQKEINKQNEEYEKENKELEKEAKVLQTQSDILEVYNSGTTEAGEIFSQLGGAASFKEIKDALDVVKPPEEKMQGEYGEFKQYQQDNPNYKGDFFDFRRKKKLAEKIETPADEGVAGGAVSGVVSRDADSIMAGVLDPSKLSTKNNYAATVMAEVAKRKIEAKSSGDIVGIIRASAGGKDTEASFNTSFEKAVNVIGQIADLQTLFKGGDKFSRVDADGKTTKFDLSPITGIIRSANPYDVKAQAIKAQLSSIVPNLARGIYGEVGVLTDNDVKIYSRTLPNLRSTEDVRNAVLGLTIRSIQRSIENKIKINANRDLTHLEDVYLSVKSQADKLLAPYEAMSYKDDLDNLDLSGEAPTDFWSKAQ